MATGRPRGFDRERALALATDIFWRKGFAATSIAELCSAMSIAPPSLYAAFGSKEELYEACIAHYMAKFAPRIWDGFHGAPTIRGAVEALFLDSAAVLPGLNKPSGCMVTLSTVGSEGSRRLGQLVEDARRHGHALVERRIEAAISDNQIRTNAKATSLARYVLSVQQGMSIQARDGQSPDELREVAYAAMAGWDALVQYANDRSPAQS